MITVRSCFAALVFTLLIGLTLTCGGCLPMMIVGGIMNDTPAAHQKRIEEAIASGDEERMEKEIADAANKVPLENLSTFADDACLKGDNKALKVLMKFHVKPRLYMAAKGGHIETCEMLLNAGLGINELDTTTKSPCLYGAIASLAPRMVDYLVVHGAKVDVESGDGHNPLTYSAMTGNLQALMWFGDASGTDFEKPDSSGNRCLHLAAGGGHLDVVQFLLNKGVTVDTANSNDMTPLYLAAGGNHGQVVSLLLTRGASVEGADPRKTKTPLAAAVSNGGLEAAKLLLDKGAMITPQASLAATSQLGDSSQKLAPARVRLLLELGANPNVSVTTKLPSGIFLANSGNSALFIYNNSLRPLGGYTDVGTSAPVLVVACDNGLIETVQLLLEKGANPNSVGRIVDIGKSWNFYTSKWDNIMTVRTMSPLGVADRLKSKEDMLNLLRRHGAKDDIYEITNIDVH